MPDIIGARVLAVLGNSVTTDHISLAVSIRPSFPAGVYLIVVASSRRRSTPTAPGGATTRALCAAPSATSGAATCWRRAPRVASISLPSERRDDEHLRRRHALPRRQRPVGGAGRSRRCTGSGSSRDWAAKGPALLGVRAVIAESFERIHRSNLLGMGILPLQFSDGTSMESLGLTGEETFDIAGLDAFRSDDVPKEMVVRAGQEDFTARVRIDTPMEAEYFRHGGILAYVLRQLAH